MFFIGEWQGERSRWRGDVVSTAEEEESSYGDGGRKSEGGADSEAGGGFHRPVSLNTRPGKKKEQNIIRNSPAVNGRSVSTSFQPGRLPGPLTTPAPASNHRDPGGAAGPDKEGRPERRRKGKEEEEKAEERERDGGDEEERSVAASCCWNTGAATADRLVDGTEE